MDSRYYLALPRAGYSTTHPATSWLSDFVVGALHASNGRSFTALTSWHAASDRSCIVPLLTEGVTSFQHSFVATERGLARCFGASASEQAANLIAVADPRARESLRSAAAAMGLV